MILETKFNLETLTHSDKAIECGIDNADLTDELFENLEQLHKLLVEIQSRLSTKYSKPINIKINSAYRCPLLNKKIGGVATSEHVLGKCADTVAIGLHITEYYTGLRELAKNKTILFGQVILEYGKYQNQEFDDWIHVGLPSKKHRNDFMVSTISNGKREYVKESI